MAFFQDSLTPANVSSESLQRCKRHKKWCFHKYYILLLATFLVMAFCGILLYWSNIFKDSSEIDPERRTLFKSKTKPQFKSQVAYQCTAVCASIDCIKTAALMFNLMDPAVDPCEDFYSYACGGYDKVVMDHKKKEFIVSDVREEILKPLKAMIEKLPRSVPVNAAGSSFAKIRKFYDSCMDLRSSEEMAIPTALKYLEYFGIKNWPQLRKNFSFTNPDLDEAIVRLSSYSTFMFYSLNIFDDDDYGDEDSNAPSSRREFRIKVMNSQLFGFDGYANDDTENLMKASLEYFGIQESTSREIIEDIRSFDQGIYNITQEIYQRKEQCEINDTISCSTYYYDCTEETDRDTNRWCKIVRKLLSDCDLIKKYPDVRIILEDKQYFHDLGKFMDHTSHRTMAHALALRFFVDNAIAMTFLIRRKASYRFTFSKPVNEMPETPSLYCTAWVSRRLPILVGTAFYSNIYKNETHTEVKEIYTDIKQSLISIVEDIPWMDSASIATAKEVLSNTRLSGDAYLWYVQNVSATDEFAAKLQITEESFLANDLEAKKFLIRTAVKALDNITEMEYLTTKYPFELDPTYDYPGLLMNFEMGSFLFPLIAVGRSRYSNLGYFGSITGHEFSHALEILLREYEDKSEYFERSLEERKRCLSQHYSEYEIDLIGEKVDGNYTFNENLADYFGFRAVYKSLTKYQEKRGFLERLPGLPFDNEQILFVSFAQLWCEANTLDSLREYVHDNHSPAKQRVWGVYKNFEPFSEAFNCPLGSPMNPVRKCNFES